MAEIILAAVCLIAGAAFALLTALVLWADAIGGVTNAQAVNNWPALIFLILAIASIGDGIAILVF